jgi:hypothetical protein
MPRSRLLFASPAHQALACALVGACHVARLLSRLTLRLPSELVPRRHDTRQGAHGPCCARIVPVLSAESAIAGSRTARCINANLIFISHHVRVREDPDWAIAALAQSSPGLLAPSRRGKIQQ